MLRELKCELCNNVLGRCHDYQRNALLRHHFKTKHPDEFMEIMNAVQKLKHLRKKYGYQVNIIQ